MSLDDDWEADGGPLKVVSCKVIQGCPMETFDPKETARVTSLLDWLFSGTADIARDDW